MPSDRTISILRRTFPRPGVVTWIAVRPSRGAPVTVVDRVIADPATGLVGDHFTGRRNTARQVTLLQAEHLPVIASFLGITTVDPGWLRRNILVEGINLLAIKDRRCRIGEAVLEVTGQCHPCSRMEENLGPGGYNAMRGHGGVTARIITGGAIETGARVFPL